MAEKARVTTVTIAVLESITVKYRVFITVSSTETSHQFHFLALYSLWSITSGHWSSTPMTSTLACSRGERGYFRSECNRVNGSTARRTFHRKPNLERRIGGWTGRKYRLSSFDVTWPGIEPMYPTRYGGFTI